MPSRSRRRALILIALVLTACSETSPAEPTDSGVDDTAPAALDSTTADGLAVDTAMDSVTDSALDTAVDSVPDSSLDAAMDVAVDSAPDTVTDTGAGDTALMLDAPPSSCTTATCATQLGVNNTHACAVRGDGAVVCWGSNSAGQLGDGTTTARNTPTIVSGTLGSVARLGVNSGSFTCALLTDGTVKCWGRNADGQLGDGTTVDRLTPTTVSGVSGAVDLYLGDFNACVRLTTGKVKCWGGNNYGQLGDGTSTNRTTAVDIAAFADAVHIGMSGLATCAVFADGRAKCVGYNGYGALGDGTMTDRPTAVSVSGLTNAIAIGVGWSHACALRSDGTVACWGQNNTGQLHDGTTTDRLVAGLATGLSDARTINVGAYQTCVLRTSGALCWSPTDTLSSLTDLAEVQAGNTYRCARTNAGAVHCWGSNANGELGDGTNTARSTPTRVSGL